MSCQLPQGTGDCQSLCDIALEGSPRAVYSEPMLTVGTPPISVRLRRSARARRLTLRLSRIDGIATLTVPLRVSERKAQSFLDTQEGWLRKQIAARPDRQRTEIGGAIPFRGIPYELVEGKRPRITGQQIELPAKNPGARLQALLKLEARNAIAPLADGYATRLGRQVNRLTLRDTRSRWGSCSQDGNLMFSWRLILAPPIVLDYVVAHEVAHLVEMNHSAAFWQVVEGLMPDYDQHRKWLRTHGGTLHAIDFTS